MVDLLLLIVQNSWFHIETIHFFSFLQNFLFLWEDLFEPQILEYTDGEQHKPENAQNIDKPW